MKKETKNSSTGSLPTGSLSSLYFRNSETEKLHRYLVSEFNELSSEGVQFYFQAARRGVNFFKAFLFDEIRRRDLRIGGICQTRKFSIQDDEWEIVPSTNSGTANKASEALAKFLQNQYSRVNVQQIVSDIVEAQLQGMGVLQLFWEIAGGKYTLSDVTLIPNYLCTTPPLSDGVGFIDFGKLSIYELRAQSATDTPRIPMVELAPEYYHEVYSLDGNEENGLLNGVIDAIILGYLFKSYGVKDWAQYLERFATPGVIGSYDPLMSVVDRAQLKDAVFNFGNLFRAVVPNTAKIDTVGDMQKSSSSDAYSIFTRYWNDELSIRVLGQAMTTDTGQGGSYAKALVGDYVREDIASGDRSLICMAMNALGRKIIDINIANVDPLDYPTFQFKKDEELDVKTAKADLLVKLKQAGFEADEEEVSKAMGFTLTKTSPPAPLLAGEGGFTETKKKKRIEEYLLDLWATLE